MRTNAAQLLFLSTLPLFSSALTLFHREPSHVTLEDQHRISHNSSAAEEQHKSTHNATTLGENRLSTNTTSLADQRLATNETETDGSNFANGYIALRKLPDSLEYSADLKTIGYLTEKGTVSMKNETRATYRVTIDHDSLNLTSAGLQCDVGLDKIFLCGKGSMDGNMTTRLNPHGMLKNVVSVPITWSSPLVDNGYYFYAKLEEGAKVSPLESNKVDSGEAKVQMTWVHSRLAKSEAKVEG